jgi:tetratricopeptide (TPR) repeat protein
LLGWGLPAWGLGSWPYTYGYSSYANPYYVAAQDVAAGPAYNYNQPIVVDTGTPPQQSSIDAGTAAFDGAREAFKSGDYGAAQQRADEALKNLPNDVDLHEFRALTLFAQARYAEAAAALYAVLNAGPGWNWATLSGFYPNVDTFTGQLRALEQYTSRNPNAASARFVLAYLYLTTGANDAAAEQLRAVVHLQPDDKLSGQLLADLSAPAGGTPSPKAPAAAPPNSAEAASAVAATPPPSDLKGTWKANGANGTDVELALGPDGHFTWGATAGGKTQSFSGTYTAGSGLLTLASDKGPPIVGHLAGTPKGGFNFKLLGSGAGDPGLTFTR